MAYKPDTYVQKFLTEHYALILSTSKTFSKDYEDLAHDVCIEITRCSECLKRVTNIKSYIFITTRNIFVKRDKPADHRVTDHPDHIDEVSPHTVQADYYNNPDLSSDEKFLLDLYMDNDLDYSKTAAAIHMNRRHATIKIKKICTKLRSSV